MDYLIGFILALEVGISANAAGFDKDRSFYATILVVIASYYLLFAAMAGSASAFAPRTHPLCRLLDPGSARRQTVASPCSAGSVPAWGL
ncbi:MAG: hypothetical protein IPJ73_03350 [Zoogloea sp.]|nr:hypothetical protein [Zoogloea sp.]